MLNLAYLAYVTASLMPGGLKLRLALIVQSFMFIAWAIVSETPTTIVWNIAFSTANIWRAVRIVRRNSVALSDEEESIRHRLFATLSRRDFLLLWSTGRSDTAPVGEQFSTEGAQMKDLVLLLDGEVDVSSKRGLHRRRGAPTFIGEMSFFSRDAASADVVACTPVRYRRWNQDDLRNLQKLNNDCSTALQIALGRDVSNKLRA
jgi:CRP-like cAMP-binding protein